LSPLTPVSPVSPVSPPETTETRETTETTETLKRLCSRGFTMQETHRKRFRAIFLGGKMCIFSIHKKMKPFCFSFVSHRPKNLVKSKVWKIME
jgi:hypothetical protein